MKAHFLEVYFLLFNCFCHCFCNGIIIKKKKKKSAHRCPTHLCYLRIWLKQQHKKRYLEVSTILEYTHVYYGKGNQASSRHQFLGFSWHGVEDCLKMLTRLDHGVPADIWAASLRFFHIPGEVSSWWHGVLLSTHYKTGKHVNMAINGWIWSGAVLRNNTVWPSSDDRLILRGPVFTVVCKQCIS